MRNTHLVGAIKVHKRVVRASDLAIFEGDVVHQVCSTFALAREMEWASRLFVLDMIDDDEEGVGTMLEINHKGLALEGEELVFTAIIVDISQHEIISDISVKCGERIIATGRTGQKILKKTKIDALVKEVLKYGR